MFCVGIATKDGYFVCSLNTRFELGRLHGIDEMDKLTSTSTNISTENNSMENNSISSQVINPFWSGNWLHTCNKHSLQIGISSFLLDCMSFSAEYYSSDKIEQGEREDEENGIRVCI